MDIVCRNIRHLRKQYDLTQKEMAQILGISTNSLRKLEKGILPRCFRAQSIRRLCSYFQISADIILEEELT